MPLFWNAPLPWKVLMFSVLLVAPAAKPTVPWLSSTVAALAVSRFTPRVALMLAAPTVTELPAGRVTVLPPSAKTLALLPPSVRATPVSVAAWLKTSVRAWPIV